VPPSTTPDAHDELEGRRDRKKRQTRERLIDTAAELFASAGFNETTTTDIAEAADVAQRTLFRHFPTKEAVLYGDMDDLRVALSDALRSRPADEPVLEVVRRAVLSLADDHQRNAERRLLQARLAATVSSVSAYSRAVVQASWEREIIAAVADRLSTDPVTDPRPEIIAGAAMSALRVAMRQWTADGGRADFVELADTALRAIADLPRSPAKSPR
jgi:AcrR family transcriptional regulator